ncbi:RagB/SusD family nutrient uptake outer membrane protein [Sediminicola luteus]|uniref:RagB/SusD domain-containing protein n=1 Tax=Sediminicola luteus TaxID=319238 RepID=A0A2A4G8Z9_9FLAO|nr:RagB/SusD family nutrient uptake outer membrane protein [Sediminicola luteus]PCE64458.1 hypothetical protein B7P33_09230 [Sediminicola luteus]
MKKSYLIGLFTFLGIVSCNIEEEILDEALGKELIDNAQVENLIAPAYNQLRDVYGHRALFALQDYSSDNAMLPTRQNDWFDGGTFQELHRHDWTATHAYVRDTWNHLMSGIGNATQALTLVDPDSREHAEMLGLLAFYMATTLDLYDQVPYRGITDIDFNAPSTILKGEAAFTEIISILDQAMPKLGSGKDGVRFNQDAAKALKARMYLNRGVYQNRYGSATFDSADMQEVITLCSELIGSGNYALESEDYFKLFDPDNEGNSEIIFAVKNELTSPSLGGASVTRNSTNGMSRGYFLTPSRGIRGSDAGCTLPEFLDTFDAENDPRFAKRFYPAEEGAIPLEEYIISRGFQEGQQYGAKIVDGAFSYNADGLLEITALRSTRDQSLANHTRDVNLIAVNQSTGVRVIKWGIDTRNDNRNDTAVDIPIFRLADIYLMRAEAEARNGGSALNDVNAVRTARGGADFALAAADLSDVYNERGFEFYWEYHRRTDQIRFGKWEDSWTDKTSSDTNYRIYPIPPASVAVTPGLEQNPGY